MQTIKTLLVVLALGVLTATSFGVSKAAALEPDTNLCGGSYARVGTVPVLDKNGNKGGVIKVYWSEKQGKNCAVNEATGALYGVEKRMLVKMCIDTCGRDARKTKDVGDYLYFAGPVYLLARSQCITVKGEIEKPGGAENFYKASERGWCN